MQSKAYPGAEPETPNSIKWKGTKKMRTGAAGGEGVIAYEDGKEEVEGGMSIVGAEANPGRWISKLPNREAEGDTVN